MNVYMHGILTNKYYYVCKRWYCISHRRNHDINKHQSIGKSYHFHILNSFYDMMLYLCRNTHSNSATVNPQIIDKWIRCTVAIIINNVKTNYSEKYLSRCHSVHHKSHMDCPRRTRISKLSGRLLTDILHGRLCQHLSEEWCKPRLYERFVKTSRV